MIKYADRWDVVVKCTLLPPFLQCMIEQGLEALFDFFFSFKCMYKHVVEHDCNLILLVQEY